MNHLFMAALALLLSVPQCAGVYAQPAAEQKEDTGEENLAAVEVSPAKVAIRQSINSYVAAFNQADAKALAAHWTENGEMTTPAGRTIVGRLQLEADFADYFSELEGAKLEIIETEIVLISPSAAIETGTARVLVPAQEPRETDYEAVHVKTVAGWKIDNVSEQQAPAAPPSHHQQLRSLEWMIGTWVDQDDDVSVETNCRWTPNRNFLVRSFQVIINDQIDFEGTQVIGWDPSRNAIRSWLFDSDGGFGVGHWTQDDSRWVVRTLSVLPDGRQGSSTHVYEQVDDQTLRFRVIGRQIDGELMPNIDPITITRISDTRIPGTGVPE
ncbi:MAG: nuclear transport factor 2 family protein [Planctomycetota bacterium]